jgi:putative DNA methylase
VARARRPEELTSAERAAVWSKVNAHLGTRAHSLQQLVEQLGVMRYGHRPRVADTFAGSGQIAFAAAQLGCQVYASDLNPIACMLTWASFQLVGGSAEFRAGLRRAQEQLTQAVQRELDALGVESDQQGFRPKTLLYCLEARCPTTGWKVPLLSTRVLSKRQAAIAVLVPNPEARAFDIAVRCGVTAQELSEAERGTVRTDGRGQDPYLCYALDGVEHRAKISALRGDTNAAESGIPNRLRPWTQREFRPAPGDVFQERLYAIQWMRPREDSRAYDYEFRAVCEADLQREACVEAYVARHIQQWQRDGIIPDMRIEPGLKTDEPIRTRGWMYWHQLFAPRQLLFLALTHRQIRERNDSYSAPLLVFFARLCDWSSKLCRYGTGAARESVAQTFYNQALNPLFTYGVRSFSFAKTYLLEELARSRVVAPAEVACHPAEDFAGEADIFITDPPYGDAVKYEEILEFFIAWLHKNPPGELAAWTWDSRRALAIRGEDAGFRRGMAAAYRTLADHMPRDGVQVIMFAHQSRSLWADLANIVWASGLRVTAAWHVVTETDSALREGSYVKGTVLLVLRKREGCERTTRDHLARQLTEEVAQHRARLSAQVQRDADACPATDQADEPLFSAADVQMASYAVALRVLTRYAIIDGQDMTTEALRPRGRGQLDLASALIDFAVSAASQR